MKDYLKKEWKSMLKAFLATVVVTVICLMYIKFIGEPMTEARNLFNRGVRLYQDGNLTEAKVEFEKSNQLWWTEDADQYINLISDNTQGL